MDLNGSLVSRPDLRQQFETMAGVAKTHGVEPLVEHKAIMAARVACCNIPLRVRVRQKAM